MGQSTGDNKVRSMASQTPSTEEGAGSSGREWDSESNERIDDRDAENIDLDTDCLNETLERKGSRT